MLPDLNYEEYIDYYHTQGKTIDQMNTPNKTLNELQLRSKFEKYQKKLKKQEDAWLRQIEKKQNKEYTKDERWEQVKQKVITRDKNQCQLWAILTKEEKDYIHGTTGNFLLNTIDPAHVFPRSTHPHMKYNADNVVMLSRLFHSRLDHFYDPILGDAITREQQREYWKLIIGVERYKKLEEQAKNFKRNKNEID